MYYNSHRTKVIYENNEKKTKTKLINQYNNNNNNNKSIRKDLKENFIPYQRVIPV